MGERSLPRADLDDVIVRLGIQRVHDPIEDGRIKQEMLAESASHSGFEYHHGLVVTARGVERVHFRKNRGDDSFSRLRARGADDVDDS